VNNGNQTGYTNWSGNNPDNSNGTENCIEIVFNARERGLWNDIHCNNFNKVVCEFSFDI